MNRRSSRVMALILVAALAAVWLGLNLGHGSAAGPLRLDYAPEIKSPSEIPAVNGDPTPLGVNLYVPYFSQCDSSWRNNVMQTCGYTICQAGCALTSTAMVFKYYGCNTNPATLNTCLGNYACPIYWYTASSSCSCGKASCDGKYSFSINGMRNALNAGKPVILEVVRDGSTHWVVVREYRNTGSYYSDYYINDPCYGTYRCLTYYTDNGWSPRYIVIYSKK